MFIHMTTCSAYYKKEKAVIEMNPFIKLSDLPTGQTAIVADYSTNGISERIYDLGITKGCEIRTAFKAPFGDPVAYEIKHALIALRRKDSEQILVRCKNDI